MWIAIPRGIFSYPGGDGVTLGPPATSLTLVAPAPADQLQFLAPVARILAELVSKVNWPGRPIVCDGIRVVKGDLFMVVSSLSFWLTGI
mgnify:FL=1